jgi:hypothetical protein
MGMKRAEPLKTLFNYRYRDADNYKAHGTIALEGQTSPERWRAALSHLDACEFFIAEQIDVPPLYKMFGETSGEPTLSDHCWHEFIGIEVTEEICSEVHMWGNVGDFTERLLAIDEWQGDLSPYFFIGAVGS